MNVIRQRLRAYLIFIIRKLGLYEQVFALMRRRVKTLDMDALSPRAKKIYFDLQNLHNQDMR
jgi:hypothetical protein